MGQLNTESRSAGDRTPSTLLRSMVLTLLTRILVWAALGLFIWYVLLKFIPRNFLTWFGGAIILGLVILSFVDPADETVGAIWRILSFPLTPLGAPIFLMILALSEGLKNPRQQRYVATALAILLISSVPLFARFFVNQAEQAVQDAYDVQRGICQDVCPATIPESAPLSRVVGIVVLGENVDAINPLTEVSGRVESTSTLNPILVSRLNTAATLYQRVTRETGAAPFVLVTAGPIDGDDEEEAQEEQRLRQILADRGVPPEAVIIEDYGMGIYSTFRETQDILETRGQLDPEGTLQRDANRVVIVAPAITMRRAALTFEAGDVQTIAYPTNLYGAEISIDDTLVLLSDLVPNVEALRLTTIYWNEVLTSFYYFLRGWLPPISVRWGENVELFPQ